MPDPQDVDDDDQQTPFLGQKLPNEIKTLLPASLLASLRSPAKLKRFVFYGICGYILATCVFLYIHRDAVTQHLTGYIYRPSQRCFPYDQPGRLLIRNETVPIHQFTSLSGECPAKNDLLHLFVNGEAPPSLHNKRILLIGDSIDLALLAYFMALPGAVFQDMGLNPEFPDLPADMLHAGVFTFTQTNTSIGHYWFHGFDEHGDWDDGEQKWRTLYTKLIQTWGHYDPHLIVTQFGYWDLARYQKPSNCPTDHEGPVYPGLQGVWIQEWLDSADDFIAQLTADFPSAALYWRVIHLAVDRHSWFNAPPNGAHPLRVLHMRQLQLAFLEKHRDVIHPFRLDALIDYQEGLMRDSIHPNTLGNSVYAEGVLAILDTIFGDDDLLSMDEIS